MTLCDGAGILLYMTEHINPPDNKSINSGLKIRIRDFIERIFIDAKNAKLHLFSNECVLKAECQITDDNSRETVVMVICKLHKRANV